MYSNALFIAAQERHLLVHTRQYLSVDFKMPLAVLDDFNIDLMKCTDLAGYLQNKFN